MLLLAKLEDTARGSNDDVWRLEALKELDVVLDGLPTVDHISTDVSHVLGEADELILDLIGQLTGVAEDDGTSWFRVFGEVLQHC